MGYYTDITELPPRYNAGRGQWTFRWRDDYTDKLYQLYVNGELAARTRGFGAQKELTVGIAGPFQAAILAVDAADAGTDYSDELNWIENRVQLSFGRDPREYKEGDSAQVFWDAGTGTLDESAPINDTPILIFPPGTRTWAHFAGPLSQTRHGWGGPGVPWGRRVHGLGPFQVGMDYIQFRTLPLAPGTYKFRVKMYDQAGNASAAADTGEIEVDSNPPPPTLAVTSLAAGALTLTVTEGEGVNPYA